jgi:hypothetical protein
VTGEEGLHVLKSIFALCPRSRNRIDSSRRLDQAVPSCIGTVELRSGLKQPSHDLQIASGQLADVVGADVSGGFAAEHLHRPNEIHPLAQEALAFAAVRQHEDFVWEVLLMHRVQHLPGVFAVASAGNDDLLRLVEIKVKCNQHVGQG